MRFRVSKIVFALAVTLATIVLLYQVFSLPADSTPLTGQNVLENRLRRLEDDIVSNQETIFEIKNLLKKLSVSENNVNQNEDIVRKINPKFDQSNFKLSKKLNFPPPNYNVSRASVNPNDCLFSQSPPSMVDVRMSDVYDKLKFDNPNGGAWKQGWDISYQTSQWSPLRKLKVFVVPHSHNDPGWLKTFEVYFRDQTQHILDNMVVKLQDDPRRKFIWAEISYFSLWWKDLSDRTKDSVRSLVSSGQLEIVTGGWVMPDEANTHYSSLLDQLITGHEWLANNLNYQPNSGWSIDPFGMSPTMAYILKRSGLENMLIQRTHYSVKKHLAAEKNLEFRWRQIWDAGTSTEILCHMMPFYSYDVPHTCGPNPEVCCQFDFKRLPGTGVTCPWRKPPRPITSENVESRSKMLLDQYRKKSQLYKTNVVLIPLGDDFRYDKGDEWDAQYNNYQKLFNHMNGREDLHVHAQFGTLSDYFQALREESKSLSGEEESLFPSLSGDFFSYADRDDHYWTGYFTTRPYHKGRERILKAYLRCAEILFTTMMGTYYENKQTLSPAEQKVINELMDALVKGRNNLGLFQHHDGITGTAKNHVVHDYAEKMLTGIVSSQHVIQHAANFLLSQNSLGGNDQPDAQAVYFDPGETFSHHLSLGEQKIVLVKNGVSVPVVLHNPESHSRSQLVSLSVSSPFVHVLDETNKIIKCQVDPVLQNFGTVHKYAFLVTFLVDLKAISLTTFYIKGIPESDVDREFVSYGEITTKNARHDDFPRPFTVVKEDDNTSPIRLKSGHTEVELLPNGLLSAVGKMPVLLQFVKYGSKQAQETSGAYLFLPDGEAKEIVVVNAPVKIIRGPLITSVRVTLENLEHNLRIKNSPGVDGMAIEIDNYVNLIKEHNTEIAMRFVSTIRNENVSYTDLNGFHMIKRFRYKKLPLQANFYPIATQAFIEDTNARLTILTKQPLGGTSLRDGQLEIMQDRRLSQDDNRGLGQGVLDNVLTLNAFRILVEHYSTVPNTDTNIQTGYPSLTAHTVLNNLLHPIISLHSVKQNDHTLNKEWNIGGSLPCDVELVNLRTMIGPPEIGVEHPVSSHASLILHRKAFHCGLGLNPPLKCSSNGGKLSLRDLFPHIFAEEVSQTSLSAMYDGLKMSKSYSLSLQPMEAYAFKVYLNSNGPAN